MALHFNHIKPLISPGKNTFSKWAGYIGLGIGVLLLFIAVQMFYNIQQMLQEKSERTSGGYDYISISKKITNENMGADNSFSTEELQSLKGTHGIADVAPLISNQFRVRASAGGIIPFSTDLFLESLPDSFLDTLPPTFSWQPGQITIPVIFSSDLLEMYNVFAPAQGLPQISPKTLTSVNIILECSGPGGTGNFKANVVAMTDRINSLLVPKNFMNWANLHLAGSSDIRPSRVYIKTRDANNPQLISYLDANHYHLNKDKIKFGRIKGVLQKVTGSLGLLGIGVIVLALILFSFYLQLIIARSKDNLRLLMTLGYSPGWLSASVARNWLPVYVAIIVSALVITLFVQLLFSQTSFGQSAGLTLALHWTTLLTALLLLGITVWINKRLVSQELKTLI